MGKSQKHMFDGTRWIDQNHGGMHVPCTEIIVWNGGANLGGTFMEFSTCVRTMGNETHAIAIVAKKHGEPFCFVAEGIMRQPYPIGAKTLEEAKAETEAKIEAIVDAACEWADVPKYLVVRSALHEGGKMVPVGAFRDYGDAESAVYQDMEDTANKWGLVWEWPEYTVIGENSVSDKDGKFVWQIFPIA